MKISEGSLSIAAKRTNTTSSDWLMLRSSGFKWCTGCRDWHEISKFGIDNTRTDKLSTSCLAYKRANGSYVPIAPGLKSRTRSRRSVSRDGDKEQAHSLVARAVRVGRLPHPNTLPCFDCGHIWKDGERRHEYDHYLLYDAIHHLDVQPVCTWCHVRRDNKKIYITMCINGHEYIEENTGRKKNGTRFCKECRRIRSRKAYGSKFAS